jgi:hypothetical protein
MYIGKREIDRLACFLAGVNCAEGLTGKRVIDFAWNDFEKWVTKKIRRKLNGKSFQAALLKCDDDQEKAFDLWMSWCDEYEKKVQGGK